MNGSNYPDGMTNRDYEYLKGTHCPECERSGSCDDNEAHENCVEHTQTRDEYLADRAGL